MLPWQPNKIATGHKTHKLDRQSSNDHNCQIWFCSHHFTGYGENAIYPFSHYKSIEVFCYHGSIPRGRLADIAISNCLYPLNICTQLESYCFSGFGRVVIKKKILFFFFFLNLMLPRKQMAMQCTNWEENHQMIITAKYDSHHFTGYEENAI